MSDENDFKAICSTTLTGNGCFSMSFPVAPQHVPFVLSRKNNERAIEYYLLARYAHIHQMHSAYMINAFWATEHLLLALLSLKSNNKDDLRDEHGAFHKLPKYWRDAKAMVGEEKSSIMSRFDDFIGRIQGYFGERYPAISNKGTLHYTSEKARVVMGDNPNAKAAKLGKTYQLSIDELDHFVNFMLHDITSLGNDMSCYTMEFLDRQNNVELYLEKNRYSIIHPNKSYHGELTRK